MGILDNVFMASLEQFPQVAGVVLASGKGSSRSVLRNRGFWQVRWSPGGRDSAHWSRRHTAKVRGLRDSLGAPYDARARGWYRKAMVRKGELSWSDPYRFAYDGEYGVTLAKTIRGAGGQEMVFGLHVALKRFAAATQDIVIGRHGFAMMVSADGRVLTLPNGRGVGGWLMAPVDSLGDEVVGRGYRLCGGGSVLKRNIQFDASGESWLVRASPLDMSGDHVTLLTLVPRGDFESGKRSATLLLLAATGILLLGAAMLVYLLSRLLTEPLEKLAAQMDRIGALDFSQQPELQSPWLELEQVSQAQEGMRRILERTTANLEEEIQEKTAQLRRFFLIIEQSPIAVLITDREGRIEYANPHAQITSGYSKEELEGQNPRMLRSPAADLESMSDLLPSIKAGISWKGEFLNRSKDGRD